MLSSPSRPLVLNSHFSHTVRSTIASSLRPRRSSLLGLLPPIARSLMSFGRPGNFADSFSVSPPEKGSFPLDHDHDCSPVMKQYLSCLRKNELKNEKCRDISKAYLQCRFDHGLMEKADWPSLGFPDVPAVPSAPLTANNPVSAPSVVSAPPTQPAPGAMPPADAGKGSSQGAQL